MLKSPKDTKTQRKIKKVPLCFCASVPLCLILFFSFIFAQSITQGFKARKMDGEIIKWELEADSAQFDENSKTLKGVEVKFYPKDKDPFTIKADDGVVKENVSVDDLTVNGARKRDEIYLKNNVQVIGYLNSDIKCDSLSWDSVSETMYTQGKVEIEAEKWTINGEGIEFAPSGDIMIIKKDVTMQVN